MLHAVAVADTLEVLPAHEMHDIARCFLSYGAYSASRSLCADVSPSTCTDCVEKCPPTSVMCIPNRGILGCDSCPLEISVEVYIYIYMYVYFYEHVRAYRACSSMCHPPLL